MIITMHTSDSKISVVFNSNDAIGKRTMSQAGQLQANVIWLALNWSDWSALDDCLSHELQSLDWIYAGPCPLHFSKLYLHFEPITHRCWPQGPTSVCVCLKILPWSVYFFYCVICSRQLFTGWLIMYIYGGIWKVCLPTYLRCFLSVNNINSSH